ncbi:DUF397 domain-containing protein [Flindersiella endophytica]
MTEQWSGWRKARASGNQGGSCVEVARATNRTTMGVRDSKDRGGPVLAFEVDAWSRFVDGVRACEFGR